MGGRHKAGPELLGGWEGASSACAFYAHPGKNRLPPWGGGFVRLRVLRPPREEQACGRGEKVR